MSELIIATTERDLALKCPTFGKQYDLHRRVAALKNYTKDKRYAITDIVTQCLMARTISEALKTGEVRATAKGTYQVDKSEINGAEVDRWRKLRKIPVRERERYFADVKNPSRNGLLKWWAAQEIVSNGKEEHLDECVDQIILGRWQEKSSVIADSSVELIFTDPPYYTDFVPQYGELAHLALRILIPGGSLITYVGHRLIPQILSAMAIHGLSFYWINAVVHTGNKSRMPLTGQIVGFKPLLWLVKGTNRFDTKTFVEDTIISSPDKKLHKWQQGAIEAEYYVDKLSTPGGLVCDPYCGSGTTPRACKKLGRKWISFDTDAKAIKTARKELVDAEHK